MSRAQICRSVSGCSRSSPVGHHVRVLSQPTRGPWVRLLDEHTVRKQQLASLEARDARRLPSRRKLWTIAALAVSTAGVVAGLSFGNLLRDDAVDRLPSDVRSSVERALAASGGCGNLVAHVEEIVPAAGGLDEGFSFRCSWSILGWPSFDGTARCVDGQWSVSGWRETHLGSEPCGGRGDTP